MTDMEPEEVANRMKAVGLKGGMVMLVWHNRFNRKNFFAEERRRLGPGPGHRSGGELPRQILTPREEAGSPREGEHGCEEEG